MRTKEDISRHLLEQLNSIIMDPDAKVQSKIKAIELYGREFGLFTERKQVNVDINTIVHQLSDSQLQALTTGGGAGDYIDVLPGVDVGTGAGGTEADRGEHQSDPGTPGVGPKDKPRVDKKLSRANREETK